MFFMIDTNIIVRDFKLKSKPFRDLIDNAKTLGLGLFFSETVLKEVIQKYKERLINYSKVIEPYKFVLPDGVYQPLVLEEIERFTSEYEKFLKKSFIENKGFQRRMAYIPRNVQVRNVLERCLKREKPFKENGKGFRDTLIWEELKEAVRLYCDEEKKFAFITNNLSDFTNMERASGEVWYYPAANLMEECYKDGLPDDTIRIYPDLRAFTSDVVSLRLEEFKSLAERLNGVENRTLVNYLTNSAAESMTTILTKEGGEVGVDTIRIEKAEILRVFRSWGDPEGEAIFLVSVEAVCQGVPKKEVIFFHGTGEFYVHFNVKNEKFVYFEGGCLSEKV